MPQIMNEKHNQIKLSRVEKKLDEINKKIDLLAIEMQKNFNQINETIDEMGDLDVESNGTIEGAIREIKNVTK